MNSKEKLYEILDELYGAAQALKDFGYVLGQVYESFPVAGDTEIKAVVTCCRTYAEAVEHQITEQLDTFDEILTDL